MTDALLPETFEPRISMDQSKAFRIKSEIQETKFVLKTAQQWVGHALSKLEALEKEMEEI
jgi:hypothetical protein